MKDHKLFIIGVLILVGSFLTACDEASQTSSTTNQPLVEGTKVDDLNRTNDFSTQTGNAFEPILKAAVLTINDEDLSKTKALIIEEMESTDIIGCRAIVSFETTYKKASFRIQKKIIIENSVGTYEYDESVSWDEIQEDFHTEPLDGSNIRCDARLYSLSGHLLSSAISHFVQFIYKPVNGRFGQDAIAGCENGLFCGGAVDESLQGSNHLLK